jgi:release factor glutamine methyltransferase
LWFNGQVKTVAELLESAARALPRRDGIPDPRREASWLLARAAGVDETWLRVHAEAELSAEVTERFCDWIRRRGEGEPAHHLFGTCTFWGRDFEVSPAVLVPRPETELIVEVALALPITSNARVLDVGTGSGCLAVTLAAERPCWSVRGVDRSLAAVEVARHNVRRHDAEVQLVCGDLASSLFGAYELVVANLPYIPSGRLAGLPSEVQHDPLLALDGGHDGLDLIRILLSDLPRLLVPCGGAILELGEDQAEKVTALADNAGLAVARRVRDLSGCERVVVLERRR